MDSLTLIFLTVFLILILYWILQGRNNKTPPGPMGLPIVGYIPFMTSKPYLDFDKLAKTYGPIFSLKLGSHYSVIFNDFYSTKEAFAQDAFIGRPPESPFELNKETLETGAFNELPWIEQRRFSLQMFRDLGFGRPRMEELIKEEIMDLLEHFEKTEEKPIEVRPLLAPSMSNNIASLVFGYRLPYDNPRRKLLDNCISESARQAGQVTWQIFFPWLAKILNFLHLGGASTLSKVNKIFRDYVNKEIEQHEKTLNEADIRDYIDGYLLEIRKRHDPAFCKPVLADMVGTFFGAGSETVRLTLEWLLLTMATYPDVQKQVQAEIDEIISCERLPTWKDHHQMPYTEAVIMELMRWKTIIPINILRYTLTDAEVNGFFIPKHSLILSNLWAIHHNTEYWGNDANIFYPERFLTEDGKGIKKIEYFIPFSIGKRACPGATLAREEVFLYFVSILQKFSICLPEGKVPDLEADLGIGLTPRSQKLCLKKRN